MDISDTLLKLVTTISTVVLFLYGLYKGYDTLELFVYNIYFIALILYLIKTNFINENRFYRK